MELFKNFIWLIILGAFAYGCVIIAMIWGWGLCPISWFWVITGYFMANLSWPISLFLRQKFLDLLK